jgi:hypothetical protein
MSELAHEDAPRSRRALLLAAAGAAGAAAASMAIPATTLGADPNDVVKNTENVTTALTAIAQGTTDTDAFAAYGNGTGVGVIGTTDLAQNAGVVGLRGDSSGSAYATQPFELDAGVYGYASGTNASAGILGEGMTGVYAYGDIGLFADGDTIGVFAMARPNGAAVHAHAGSGSAPASLTNVALLGTVTSKSQAGLHAKGRVQLPDRSGRVTFKAGDKTKSVSVASATSSNYAFAVLNTNRTGIYVRAVVPASGKITIYLNKAPSSSTSVAWVLLG